VNRGKRSIALDLRSPEGLERARELATTADVVIENFKPGTMQKFGLGYETIASENPEVVYCSISGFGDAAGKELPGYDLLVQAVGGLMSITGAADDAGGEPTKVGVALVDILTGLNSVIGIQAALRAREVGDAGRGQHVKVTLLGSLLSALANQASSTLETGVSPARMGNAHPSIAPYETFAAADQQVALAVGTDGQFRRLCEVIGAPEMADDARFANNPERVAHRVELRKAIDERLRLRPAAEWIEALTAANIPAGRVNNIAQAIELAESLGLGMVATTPTVAADGSTQVLRSIATPISFSETPASYGTPPPELDQHRGADWR
jgi:crotonobetainyl-CoA:carnitine CoA-transferase CaiB-like acyl-CoA transferase